MGKRSQGKFERRPQDLYDTPYRGVLPVLPFLPLWTRFIEPCFGNGYLAAHLQANDRICVGAYDLEPKAESVTQADARTHQFDTTGADCFITNPPWTRRFEIGRTEQDKIIWEEVLHPLIRNLSSQLPTWLLFDADWAFTEQAAPMIPTCSKIVAVGRLKWIEGSAHQSKDSCAWYRFDENHSDGPRLYGRGEWLEKPVDNLDGAICPQSSHIDPQDVHRENAATFERVNRELSPSLDALLQEQ